MKKKVFALVMAMVMVVGCLASCGGGNDGGLKGILGEAVKLADLRADDHGWGAKIPGDLGNIGAGFLVADVFWKPNIVPASQ